MDSCAQTLDQIRGRVGGVLEQLLWQGADAHTFFQEWASRFSGMIGSAAAGLHEASLCLHAQATEQRTASDGNVGFLEPLGGAIALGALASGVARMSRVTVVEKELKELGIADEDLKPLKYVDELGLGGPLALAGFAVDLPTFLMYLSANPGSAETLKSGVDLALSASASGLAIAEGVGDAAVLAGVVASAPELGVAIAGLGIAEGANDLASHFDPDLDQQVWHGAETAGRVVASGVGDAFSLIGRNPLNWVPAL